MTKRVTASILTGLLALVGTMLFAASPAYADVSCGSSYASPNDSGGRDVRLAISEKAPCPTGNELFFAAFNANGETLTIGVHDADDHGYYKIWVDSKVYNSSGTVIDTDQQVYDGSLSGDNHRDYNIGTPDGSGDIAEGLKISLRLCGKVNTDGSTKCTLYINGIA